MLDLIKYERSVGNLERSAEIIYELVELVSVEALEPLLPLFSTSVLQRLGYLLAEVIQEDRLNPTIFSWFSDIFCVLVS